MKIFTVLPLAAALAASCATVEAPVTAGDAPLSDANFEVVHVVQASGGA